MRVVSQSPPPGYPPPPVPYVSPSRRLRLVQVAVVATTVVSAAMLLVSVASARTLFAAMDLDPAGRQAEISALDVPQEVVDQIVLTANLGSAALVLLLLSLILNAIAVIRWQAQALRNFAVLAVPPPRYGPVIAGIVWFVPIMYLYAPKLVFNDIWRSGAPQAPPYLPVADFRALPLSRLPLPWWICVVGTSLLSGLSSLIPIEPLYSMAVSDLVDAGIQLPLIVAGLCFLPIVRDAGRRQDTRYAALTSAAHPRAFGQTPTDSGTSSALWAPGPGAWTSP